MIKQMEREKIDMIIKQQLIKDTPYKYGRGNRGKKVTIHQTGNYNKGANAQAHANLQSRGNTRNASWHWQVDDKQAIQSFTHDFQLWHAGDGKGMGNLQTIGIEVCVNKDGNYRQTIENLIELLHYLKINPRDIYTHQTWSGKKCPSDILKGREGLDMKYIKDQLRTYNTRNNTKSPETEFSVVSRLVKETLAGKHGNGEDRKKSLGSYYRAVQNEINRRLNKSSKTNHQRMIDMLVKEVEQGKHGNGNQRKKSLGKHYREVQNIINKKYRR